MFVYYGALVLVLCNELNE